MKTLYLIDGHAQLYRAHHAIRTPMSSPVTKEPTNATFGFTAMLLKMLRAQKPDYVVMVVDVSGDRETFRSEIYPEYKAHREEIPEALPAQVDRCVGMLREAGVPVLGVAGVEADDVIASIVERLKREAPDVLIRIVSKDKDLMQLLEEGRVEMYDVPTDTLIDVAQLKEDKGVAPEQVVDMLALMGDSVDNVPGVPGIGPKTAAQLIAEYGTLDNLMAHAAEIKGKRGENIRASAGVLPLSKSLVTLRRDTPVDFDLDRAAVKSMPLERLAPIFRELGFNRFQEELKEILGEKAGPGEAAAEREDSVAPAQTPKGPASLAGGLFDVSPVPKVKPQGKYTCVRTRAELTALVKALKGAALIAFDTETTGLEPMRARLAGMSFAVEHGAGWYVPVRSPEASSHLSEEEVLGALRPILEDAARPKTGHNIKFDLLIMRRAGVELRGVVFDSMIGSFLVDSSRSSHGMDSLALALLGYTTQPITDLIGSGKSQRRFDEVPLEDATPYAAEDADVTLRLHDTLAPQLKAMRLESLNRDVEVPLIDVLADLEWNGIACDPAELDRQAAALGERAAELRRQIIDAAPRPFNPDSPKQLAGILFNKPTHAEEPGLGIKPIKKTKTGYSTDVEVLEELAADAAIETPVPRLIVEHRQLTKLIGTYLVALKEAINPETKRIHSSFHQTGAATGRLASSDPNLQNIPIRTDIGRAIRKAFVAPRGRVLVGADYSQIELRMLGHLSRDPALIEAFERGEDIHRAVAAQIHGVKPSEVTPKQRDGAKMVNFGIVYGITPYGLARRLGIGNEEAAGIIDGYKARYTGIATFLEECIVQAQRFGYVETILKRRRPITGIDARNPQQRALAERVAINSVVQGSAADLIKLAMLDLHTRLSPWAAHRRVAAGMKPEPEIPGVLMLLQIHDELVFEAPEERAEEVKALVKSRMEGAMELRVPLKVEAAAAKSWFEGK